MTNEHYLYGSYFIAVASGTGLAAITAALLRNAHCRALASSATEGIGRILRRVFPAWLILAVLLGFVSVTYVDCGHTNYAQVIADGRHLVAKSQQQASRMLHCLAGTLMAYAIMLTALLCVVHRRKDGEETVHVQ